VPLILLIVSLPIIVIALMPLILFQRYRMGSSRRLARPWMATLGMVSMAVSAIVFLITAAVTNLWIPQSLAYAAMGMGFGALLGGLGLMLTRWESLPQSLHYTANRWLVLAITLVVSARVLFGLYRSILFAEGSVTATSAISAFGIPQSLAAGAIVIGYYLTYNAGLRWRIRTWQQRPLRRL
jgi:hypothetical protein